MMSMTLTSVNYAFVKQRNGTWIDDGCAIKYRSGEIEALLKEYGFPDRSYFLYRAEPGDVVELLGGKHLIWYFENPLFSLS